MTDWLKRFHETFGDDRDPGGSPAEYDCWLRFELGGEDWGTDRPIRRFLQAHFRACEIAERAFKASDQIYALIRTYGTSDGIDADFSRLRGTFPKILKRDFDFDLPENSPEEREFWHVLPIEEAIQCKELLWLDIAVEMGIGPAAQGSSSYLVDFDRKIIAFAYDDRGMDVVSMDKSVLRPVYDEFRTWILDTEQDRVRAFFGEH